MALIRWKKGYDLSPFSLLGIHKDLDKLFGFSFVPALDVFEEKDKLVVRADLPGLKQEEIEVNVEDDILTVKGERKEEAETKEKDYYRFERSYGSFSRSVALPEYVDASKTKATYKDGVLELTIPKIGEARKKPLKINFN